MANTFWSLILQVFVDHRMKLAGIDSPNQHRLALCVAGSYMAMLIEQLPYGMVGFLNSELAMST
jgi:hypothetical protein